jgi:signal transduction histidine kinase
VLDRAFAGEVVAVENQMVLLRRGRGELEERVFSASFSPVRDEAGAVGGVFHPLVEIAQALLAERQWGVLLRLSDAERQLSGPLAILATAHETLAQGSGRIVDYGAQALRESETQFHLMADAVPQIVRITGPTGRMGFFNRQLTLCIGAAYQPFDPAAVAARFMTLGDGSAVVAAFEAALRSSEPFQVEHRIRSKAGEYRCFLTCAESLRDPRTGEILVIDVTERLRSEAQLAEAQEQLRRSQKMEHMGSLTGGVAHDFNDLLTLIIASLDRLLRRGIGSGRERRLMDGALQSAERAKVLMQCLLAFARRQPLQPGPVDVGHLIGDMAELIASTSGQRVEVRVDLPPDLPPALSDANQLEMALLNLAGNARKAMPDAGVLTISAARVSVREPRHSAKLSPDTTSACRSGTPARAWTRRRWPERLSRPSRPRAWAAAPGWGSRWCTGWPGCSAAGRPSPAARAKARPSSCGCRSARFRSRRMRRLPRPAPPRRRSARRSWWTTRTSCG